MAAAVDGGEADPAGQGVQALSEANGVRLGSVQASSRVSSPPSEHLHVTAQRQRCHGNDVPRSQSADPRTDEAGAAFERRARRPASPFVR